LDDDEGTAQHSTQHAVRSVLSDIAVQKKAAEELRRAFAPFAVSMPLPTDPSASTAKVEALVKCLTGQQPTKCLVFATRRITCRLLATLLAHLLRADPKWSVDYLMAVKASNRADTFSLKQYDEAIQAFRGSLRVLVSTATVEEGLDVPSYVLPTP
jgi:ERCC4-related helicase